MSVQNRLQRLDDGHCMTIRGNIIVCKCPHLLQTIISLRGRAAELDEGDFLKKAPDGFDAVAALTPLPPRFQEVSIIVMVRSNLEFARRAILNRQFHTSFALMRIPNAVV